MASTNGMTHDVEKIFWIAKSRIMPQKSESRAGTLIVAASPQMERVLDNVARIGPSDATVLITGETGSGKEIVAREVHARSQRAAQPWVDVNCGVLPDTLMESELFGYERGAFSGADSSKAGFFEMAQGGTLFLDEIGELDTRMQVKLLRVLDGTPYYRLGGTRKISVDVRIIAATNRNLEEMVEQKLFRADLFHRLNQVPIHIPPLRERPADVTALARHFLKQRDAEMQLADDACDALLAHPWPGNIRELRNVITRAALFADQRRIGAKDLNLSQPKSAPKYTAATQTMEIVMQHAIFDALAQTNGHQRLAAERLGISARTLSRKLKTYQA